MNAIRIVLLAVVAFSIPMLLAADKPSTQPAAGDLSGTWKWSQEGFGGNSVDFTLVLKQEGNKLTGTLSGFNNQESPIEDGTVSADGSFSFKISRDFGGQKAVTTYTGKQSGTQLKGKSETVFTRDFDAKREG
jgi:hypothetical protein